MTEEQSQQPHAEDDSRTLQGFPEEDVETGEIIATSQTTGNRYRVTKWVDHGDGKITALHKELIEEGSA